MTCLNITRVVSALMLAASTLAAPATAAPLIDEPINITVSYRDLDIGHPAGAQVLLRRLEAAARKACGGTPDIRVLAEVAEFDKCRSAALDHAVAGINAPLLTAAATKSGAVVRVAHR
jgi:UrcA family protein